MKHMFCVLRFQELTCNQKVAKDKSCSTKVKVNKMMVLPEPALRGRKDQSNPELASTNRWFSISIR